MRRALNVQFSSLARVQFLRAALDLLETRMPGPCPVPSIELDLLKGSFFSGIKIAVQSRSNHSLARDQFFRLGVGCS